MGPEQIQAFRRMSPEERWRLQVELMDSAWEAMERLGPQELARRIAILNREHEEGSRRLLAGLRKANGASAQPDRPPSGP